MMKASFKVPTAASIGRLESFEPGQHRISEEKAPGPSRLLNAIGTEREIRYGLTSVSIHHTWASAEALVLYVQQQMA